MSFTAANKHGGVPFIRDSVGVLGVRGGAGGEGPGTWVDPRRTHPDHHAVGKGGGVVHLGEGWRAGAHDFPAHVEHPGSPQSQEGHSEEETPISEHANVLQRHRKAPDVTNRSVAQPGTIVRQFYPNCADTALQKAGYFRIQTRREDFENGILNQLVLDIFHVRAGDKKYILTSNDLSLCSAFWTISRTFNLPITKMSKTAFKP